MQPEDLGLLFLERANAGDVEGQPDGSWRWVIDQPALLS
jgi:hypothetical protein